MDRELLNDLDEAFDQLSGGLSAMKLMTLGLEDMQDPSADGFYAVWRYLDQAREEICRLLAQVAVVEAIA